jgi:hypothetical protein
MMYAKMIRTYTEMKTLTKFWIDEIASAIRSHPPMRPISVLRRLFL